MLEDDQLQQRVRYLIEHGGLWDDPLADIRQRTRWAMWLAAAAVVLSALQLLEFLHR